MADSNISKRELGWELVSLRKSTTPYFVKFAKSHLSGVVDFGTLPYQRTLNVERLLPLGDVQLMPASPRSWPTVFFALDYPRLNSLPQIPLLYTASRLPAQGSVLVAGRHSSRSFIVSTPMTPNWLLSRTPFTLRCRGSPLAGFTR